MVECAICGSFQVNELWLDKAIDLDEFQQAFLARFPGGIIDAIFEKVSDDHNLLILSVPLPQAGELRHFYIEFSNRLDLILAEGASSFVSSHI